MSLPEKLTKKKIFCLCNISIWTAQQAWIKDPMIYGKLIDTDFERMTVDYNGPCTESYRYKFITPSYPLPHSLPDDEDECLGLKYYSY